MLEERAAQWKEQYIQQGVVMGRAEGMNLGRAEAYAHTLQDLLELRFNSLPLSLIDELNSISDISTLRQLIAEAYHAESLDDFKTRLLRQ